MRIEIMYKLEKRLTVYPVQTTESCACHEKRRMVEQAIRIVIDIKTLPESVHTVHRHMADDTSGGVSCVP